MNATITWNANTETDLSGYNVYIGTTYDYLTDTYTWDRFVIVSAPTTTYTFNGLANRDTHFAVTAFDTTGNESAKSMVVTKCQLAQLLMARMG